MVKQSRIIILYFIFYGCFFSIEIDIWLLFSGFMKISRILIIVLVWKFKFKVHTIRSFPFKEPLDHSYMEFVFLLSGFLTFSAKYFI